MKINKELAKGSHELILLKLLSRKDMYGYQLIQEMALLSEDVFRMSQGSLWKRRIVRDAGHDPNADPDHAGSGRKHWSEDVWIAASPGTNSTKCVRKC